VAPRHARPPARHSIAALTWAISAVQLASAIAIGGAALVAEPTGETLRWLAAATLAVALACACVLLGSQSCETVAPRVVIGAITVAAAAVLCLGLLGPRRRPAFATAGPPRRDDGPHLSYRRGP
jgi:ABC-type multidrug transport system permease subunit